MILIVWLVLLLWINSVYSLSLEPWVEFEMKGGIAGFKFKLLIYQNGLACTEKMEKRICHYLNEDKLLELREILGNLELENLGSQFIPPNPIYDGYTYTIFYNRFTIYGVDPIEEIAPQYVKRFFLILREILHCFNTDNKRCNNYFKEVINND